MVYKSLIYQPFTNGEKHQRCTEAELLLEGGQILVFRHDHLSFSYEGCRSSCWTSLPFEFRATLNLKMACWPVTLEISSDDCDFRKKNYVLKNKGRDTDRCEQQWQASLRTLACLRAFRPGSSQQALGQVLLDVAFLKLGMGQNLYCQMGV